MLKETHSGSSSDGVGIYNQVFLASSSGSSESSSQLGLKLWTLMFFALPNFSSW